MEKKKFCELAGPVPEEGTDLEVHDKLEAIAAIAESACRLSVRPRKVLRKQLNPGIQCNWGGHGPHGTPYWEAGLATCRRNDRKEEKAVTHGYRQTELAGRVSEPHQEVEDFRNGISDQRREVAGRHHVV